MAPSEWRKNLWDKLCSVLQMRVFWLLLVVLAFLIGLRAYTSEYVEAGPPLFPLASLLFILCVAALSAVLLFVSSNVQQLLCGLLSSGLLIVTALTGGVLALSGLISFPVDLMQYFTGTKEFPASWKLISWWLFIAGFFVFLPRIDRRVLALVFVLMTGLMAIAVRICAVTEPFYL